MSHSNAAPTGWLARALIGLVRGYRLVLSPLVPGTCRYVPTCSEYAAEALAAHGPARGTWLTLKRLGRCHPLGGHGLDPVPPVAEPDAGPKDEP